MRTTSIFITGLWRLTLLCINETEFSERRPALKDKAGIDIEVDARSTRNHGYWNILCHNVLLNCGSCLTWSISTTYLTSPHFLKIKFKCVSRCKMRTPLTWQHTMWFHVVRIFFLIMTSNGFWKSPTRWFYKMSTKSSYCFMYLL